MSYVMDGHAAIIKALVCTMYALLKWVKFLVCEMTLLGKQNLYEKRILYDMIRRCTAQWTVKSKKYKLSLTEI